MNDEANAALCETNARLHQDIGRIEGQVQALAQGLEQSNARMAEAVHDISRQISDLSAKQDRDDESTRAVLNQLVGRGQMAVWFFSALMAVGGLVTALYNIFWR